MEIRRKEYIKISHLETLVGTSHSQWRDLERFPKAACLEIMDSELFPMCLSLALLPEWKQKDVGMIWLSVNRVDFQGRWANLSIKSTSQGSLMPVWEQLYRVLFRTLCELTMLSPHFIPAEIFHVLIWFENGFWLVLLNHRYTDTAVAVYVSNMNLLSPKLFGLEVKKKVHVFLKNYFKH